MQILKHGIAKALLCQIFCEPFHQFGIGGNLTLVSIVVVDSGPLLAKCATRRGVLSGEDSSPARSHIRVSQAYLLFSKGQSLMAQPFDAASGKFIGALFPVVERVGISPVIPLTMFSVSERGAPVPG